MRGIHLCMKFTAAVTFEHLRALFAYGFVLGTPLTARIVITCRDHSVGNYYLLRKAPHWHGCIAVVQRRVFSKSLVRKLRF